MNSKHRPGAPLDTFVVRFWRSRDVAAPRHGQAEHVQTGERCAFRDLADLVTFMEQCIGWKEENPEQPGGLSITEGGKT